MFKSTTARPENSPLPRARASLKLLLNQTQRAIGLLERDQQRHELALRGYRGSTCDPADNRLLKKCIKMLEQDSDVDWAKDGSALSLVEPYVRKKLQAIKELEEDAQQRYIASTGRRLKPKAEREAAVNNWTMHLEFLALRLGLLRELRQQIMAALEPSPQAAAIAEVQGAHQRNSEAPGAKVNAVKADQPQPVVRLRGQGQKPLVNGKEVERLSPPVYAIIEALIKAGPNGLSKRALEEIKSSAVKQLGKLARSSAWKNAILMAGKAWRGYSIRYE